MDKQIFTELECSEGETDNSNKILAVIILLCTAAIMTFLSIVSVNLYNQNRIIIAEMIRLQTEVKNLQDLQVELNENLEPVVYFLEQVNEHQQKLLEEGK
ncbi:MAG: hypothetical protein Q8M94_02165 [Ignavibacteria bacterium]|nr:hypothetical protein [Ignavibacteria bacterium]